MDYHIDTQNQEQQLAFNLIAHTSSSFFLTGRAGTGKTTFLKNIQQIVNKKFIVLAPTGIAAINAGGETIHSFFRFPLNALDFKDYGRMTPERRNIILSTDVLIIDEVSMVRCDLIDAIDRMLRHCCSNALPFGGKQIVFTGDMFQLEPILCNDGDKNLIMQNYHTDKPYFFKAKVFERLKLVSIEFLKIYRQTDAAFIDILERIRNQQTTLSDLNTLNLRVCDPGSDKMIITLTSHNATAKAINECQLAKIASDPFTYVATISGEFDEKNAPVEKELMLKAGAQVMFARNDPSGRWVNGTLGEVSSLNAETVKVKLEDGRVFDVVPMNWDNMKYEYNKVTRTSTKEVIGTFTQYPLKLAWAITIHKSQGLTFENVRIDFSRGVFANGQTYVALSRAKSLQGLYLSAPVKSSFVKTSDEVLGFAEEFNNQEDIAFEIDNGKSIGDLLARNELDAVAKILFDKAINELHRKDVIMTYRLLNRSLDYVVCDDCLFGDYVFNIGNLPNSPELYFIKAVIDLYSGMAETGLAAIESYLKYDEKSINGLYVKSRLLTLMDLWQGADEIHDTIYALIDNRFEPKLFYRASIINETKCNIPSLSWIQLLIQIAPNTLESHYRLREYHRGRNGQLIENEPSGNPLIRAFNESPDDQTFQMILPEYHAQKNEIYNQYISILEAQVFE